MTLTKDDIKLVEEIETVQEMIRKRILKTVWDIQDANPNIIFDKLEYVFDDIGQCLLQIKFKPKT